MSRHLSIAPLILALAAVPAWAQQGWTQPTGKAGVGPSSVLPGRGTDMGVRRFYSPRSSSSAGTISPGYSGGGAGYGGTGYGAGYGYTPSYGGFGRTPSYAGFGSFNRLRGVRPGATFNFYTPGFGYGFGGYGYGLPYYGYGVPPVVVTVPPVVNYVTPEVYQPLGPGGFNAGGFNPGPVDPLLAEEAREADRRWNGAVDAGDPPPPERVLPSSPQAVAEALEAERKGDEWFRRNEYGKAYGEYRRAVAVAPDRGPARFRKGFALAVLTEFDRARFEFRRALELDPSLPTTGPTLEELFGDGNAIARTAFIGKVARYAREDVRDPDRLFLLGVVMHAAGDPRAGEVFEAAWRLGDDAAGVSAYLNPVEVLDGVPVGEEPEGEPLDLQLPPLPAPDGGEEGDDGEPGAPADPPPAFTPPNVAPTTVGGADGTPAGGDGAR